jgi:hypothetical protein
MTTDLPICFACTAAVTAPEVQPYVILGRLRGHGERHRQENECESAGKAHVKVSLKCGLPLPRERQAASIGLRPQNVRRMPSCMRRASSELKMRPKLALVFTPCALGENEVLGMP